jgi:hypothetical protein
MSAISARLSKLEGSLAPSSKQFTVIQTVIIYPGDQSERLPVEPSELERLAREGYREGVDELIVIQHFVFVSALQAQGSQSVAEEA